MITIDGYALALGAVFVLIGWSIVKAWRWKEIRAKNIAEARAMYAACQKSDIMRPRAEKLRQMGLLFYDVDIAKPEDES